jgi:hypothetical protein
VGIEQVSVVAMDLANRGNHLRIVVGGAADLVSDRLQVVPVQRQDALEVVLRK